MEHVLGRLSIVATPIGNLEDITLRALRVCREAAYVLCEDTRVTGKLMKHYDIKARLKRYDAHASDAVHDRIIADLCEGKHIALVSDAGTPGVSDPGVLLVRKAREAGVMVEAIPGASALSAAVSIAGLSGNEFVFLGFAPQKKGRETFFRSLSGYGIPVIFYESPHRIMKTLDALVIREGDDMSINRHIIVARELTKMHEEIVEGSPEEVFRYFTDHPDHVRGEFVVLFSQG